MAALAEQAPGGVLRSAASDAPIERIEPLENGGAGALVAFLHARNENISAALTARPRGARLLVDASVADRVGHDADWVHPNAALALTRLLAFCDSTLPAPVIGNGCIVHPTAILHPGVVLGARTQVGAYSVLGGAGFGWARGPHGMIAMPHLGGLHVGDDVFIGAHVTMHAGVLAPTRVGSHTKIDAHVHIGHNCVLGEGVMIAAQAGLAGSVVVGNGVLIGGQAGIADHVVIGEGARIAAKAGVIGDVPAGATYAGYPAVPRFEWLRGMAKVAALARARQRRKV